MGLGRDGSGAAKVAEELGEAEGEGEDAGWHAAHRDHQGEPSAVGVRTFFSDSTEDGEHEQGGDRSRKEDRGAGGEELAGVWLHKGSG